LRRFYFPAIFRYLGFEFAGVADAHGIHVQFDGADLTEVSSDLDWMTMQISSILNISCKSVTAEDMAICRPDEMLGKPATAACKPVIILEDVSSSTLRYDTSTPKSGGLSSSSK